MKTLLVKAALGVGLLAAAGAYAEAPAGATAECKDGTYYSGTAHKGACHGHQGVKSWLNTSAAAASDTSADTATTKKSKKSKSAAAAPRPGRPKPPRRRPQPRRRIRRKSRRSPAVALGWYGSIRAPRSTTARATSGMARPRKART